MHRFSEEAEGAPPVEEAPEPLVAAPPRPRPAPPPPPIAADDGRVERLEAELGALRDEVASLRAELQALRDELGA